MNRTSLVLAMWVLAGSAAAASVSSVPLGKGTVDVRTYETGVTIHAYLTNDAMADSAFIVETQEGLVGFESPAFVSDIPLWKDYVAKLGKPLKALFLSNHPSDGKEWYGDAEVLTTARSQKAMKEGSTKAIVDGLAPAFGESFDAKFAAIDRVVPEGTMTMAGVTFEIRPDGDGFLVHFPAEKAAILHMLGADTHSIVPGAAAADAMTAVLEGLRKDGVTTLYSAHHAPEEAEALATKIRYLESVKRLAAESKTADEFKAKINVAWPGLAVPAYLDMTAGAFFPTK